VKKYEVRAWIEDIGVIPAVRVRLPEDALFAVEALAQGGIPVAEIPLTVPNAIKIISQLRKENPNMVVGAGGVMDEITAQQGLDGGAQFLTSDGLHPELIEFAQRHEMVVFPGALTPTEVISAWKAGCDFVKVVPCAQIGGETYIRSLHRMFPRLPLIAAGGVNQENALNFILAGAVALGIGGELIPSEALRKRQTDRIAELARRFVGFVKSGRVYLESRKQHFVSS
jgi:2-dehydro-3-deoxyphosphogluconate aldolase / (4S)-4-hydroxy-2-oxoglutarate aldolase